MRPLIFFAMTVCPVFFFSGCNNAATELTIQHLRDSLAESRRVIDSLEKTEAMIFGRATSLEHSNPMTAMGMYRQIASAESQDVLGHSAYLRFHYLESLKFLFYIQGPDPGTMGPDEYRRKFRVSNIDSLMTFILASRFEIYDINDEKHGPEKFTMPELRRQLTERKGPAFDMIAQLSYIYSIPYPQYHNTSCVESTDIAGIYVSLTGFQLTFQFDGPGVPFKLTKIEYLEIQDL